MKRAHAVALCLVVGSVGAVGCGYRLAGANTFLPPEIKVIAVVPFENRTTRPEIEQRVTEAVTRQFTRRGRYRVVTDRRQADAVLEGAVTGYRNVPIEFNSAGRATSVEAAVTMQATLRETATDAILWSQGGLRFTGQYAVPDTGVVVFDRETLALDEIAQDAASALVAAILEGF